MMNLITNYMTNNDCYKSGRRIIPRGIMVHTTATPGIMAQDWFSRWDKPNVGKCVHAFLDDVNVAQYLPWNYRAWHCGKSANNSHISFEICEPKEYNQDYFNKAYNNAIELAVFLCKKYNLTEKDVIGHYEGASMGIASNHSDPKPFFSAYGKTMDDFRVEVKARLNGETTTIIEIPNTYSPPPSRQQPKTYTKRLLKLTSPLMRGEDVKEVQRKLKAKGYDCGSIDGYYGQKCVEAVKRLQRDFGLVSDGIVGTKTLNVLNSNSQPKKSIPKLTRLLKLTSPMMRGEDVKILQQRLNALGFNCGNADGIFGRKTQEMVKSFQRNKGLSVDGIVGNKSWQKLF